ncbi:unnamed protein product, partial [Ilex paraguariensis]
RRNNEHDSLASARVIVSKAIGDGFDSKAKVTGESGLNIAVLDDVIVAKIEGERGEKDKEKNDGNILLCGYSFNFTVGTASIKQISEKTKSFFIFNF